MLQETGPLVKQSLEAIEEMNNVLELYRTVSASVPASMMSCPFFTAPALFVNLTPRMKSDP